MKVPMTVLRVVTLGPALLVSFVLALVVFALLPPALGLVLFRDSSAFRGSERPLSWAEPVSLKEFGPSEQ